jgi:integrase
VTRRVRGQDRVARSSTSSPVDTNGGEGLQLERPLHTLRHSYARALRRVEAPLEAVQAALDHSNLATTSIYLRQLEGQEDPWWPKLARELGLEGGGEATSPDGEQ